MKTFTTAYAAQVATKRGAKPLWILTLSDGSTTWYVSDVAATIASWNGGVTTKAWVTSWGQITEQLSGSLNEIRIADFSCSLAADPDDAANIVHLATAHNLEAGSSSLYLWWVGLDAATDPPVEYFRGRIRDVELPDEFTVQLTFEDDSIRLSTQVGTLANTSLTGFGSLPTDSVGSFLPIIYGSATGVKGIMALDDTTRVFVVADHPVASIDDVYLLDGTAKVSINGATGVTKSTDNSAYGNRATVTTTPVVTVQSNVQYITVTPPDLFSSGSFTNPANVADGNGSTYATSGMSYDNIATHNATYSNTEGYAPLRIRAALSYSGGYNGDWLRISLDGGTNWTTSYISYAASKTTVYSTWVNFTDFANLGDVVAYYLHAYTGYATYVYEIWLEVEVCTETPVAVNDLYVDITRSAITEPADVCHDLLHTYGGLDVAVSVTGSYPAAYAVDGALTSQQSLMSCLNLVAFQAASFFRYTLGTAKLLYRNVTPVSDKTIATVCLANGAKVWRRRRAQLTDILNVINLRYGRLQYLSGNNAYTGLVAVSDSTSRTAFGDREQVNLFLCDLMADGTMAADVAAYYLAAYKDRYWLHEFETFLDHIDLEFGDVVTLGFAGDAVGVVVSVGIQPGSVNDMDRIKVTVMV